ncbi:MAG TPA: hypothetical protein VKD72_19395 [Gemmataceae bacterium]|nr:hypothetical protein [Gemmataceae bacterium]
MLNVFLAVFWAMTGVCIYMLIERERPRPNLITPYPLTTLTAVLAVYNVIRWWAIRLSGRGVGSRNDWRRPPTRRPGDEVITPDPNFNFADQPPAPKASEVPPGSPGANGSGDGERK